MKRLPYLGVAAAVLAGDLYSKHAVFAFLDREAIPEGRIHWIFGEWFGLARVMNEGVTGGMGSGISPWIITALTSCAVVGILIYMMRGTDLGPWSIFALGLILGGAVGNLYDRIAFKAVRDFIDVWPRLSWPSWFHHWPTFNVADMAIVTGVCMLVFHTLFLAKPVKKKEVAGAAS